MGLVVVGVIVALGIDHHLAAVQPKGYNLKKVPIDDHTNVEVLHAEGSGFEADQNGVTLCDTDISGFRYTYEDGPLLITPLDILTATATAEADLTGVPAINASAIVAIYSPSVETVLTLDCYSISVSAEALIGAAGVGAELNIEEGKFKITPPTLGVGYSLDIDFDLAG